MEGIHTSARQENIRGPAPNTTGPHRHDTLNRLDPAVESGSNRVQVTRSGATGSDPGYGRAFAGENMNQTAITGAVQVPPATQGATHGPVHSSTLANKLDPRVDISRQVAAGTVPSGTAPASPGISSAPTANVREGTYGPHSTRVGNAMDPTVDSDLDGRAQPPLQQGAAGGYPGPAPRTAGPHRFDFANKLDPTVNAKPKKSDII